MNSTQRTRYEYARSLRWSQERRTERCKRRRIVYRLRPLAVLGGIALVYFVTLPYPREKWYVGLAGFALLLPWVAARGSE